MTKLLLWGAGGHAKVVLDCARAMCIFQDIAFIDDAPIDEFCSHPVLGTRALLAGAARQGYAKILVSIGDNRVRAGCFALALEHGFVGATIIHPSAMVSPRAGIAEGTVIMPGAIVNAGVQIGRNCIVNTGAIVEHDCVVGDHVHISPRVALGGGVRIGALAHLGLGAIALPGVTIGGGSIVGAGSVVLRTVDPATTVAGVPARLLLPVYR
jgi:sugar O-acyltransferase (sialic acid O-acetyltransferase NeuD family)